LILVLAGGIEKYEVSAGGGEKSPLKTPVALPGTGWPQNRRKKRMTNGSSRKDIKKRPQVSSPGPVLTRAAEGSLAKTTK